jgi:pyruvate dehydrogenase E2 component (dihydrolipoamide acetyltransferase)
MDEAYAVVPLSPLRKVIARRMSEAQQTIPHFRLVAELDVGPLLEARESANSLHATARVSINDCLIRACALALPEHPAINSQFVDDALRHYRDADISVIVSVGGGLATPVIRAANRKSVWAIADEAQSLAKRAAAGQLKMQEIVGGSFSVSNLGAYDVDQFDAIINPPQCAILALGRAMPRASVAGDGQIGVAQVLRATLSVDHRAVDGVAAAEFLNTLRRIVEQPRQVFAT